jgi:CRISPR-associated protein Cas1
MQRLHELGLVLGLKDFYVFQNCQLEADERVLMVIGSEQRRLPVEEISALHLLSGYAITSGVFELAARHEFPMHMYSYSGRYVGSFLPPPVEPTSSILISQVESHIDKSRRLELGRALISHSEQAIDALLEPFHLKLGSRAAGSSTEELLLAEARVRKEYYELLDTILPPFWSIVVRERNPPKRPADALLGFANGILYAKMVGFIYRAGLDPRIGYLHGDARARNPLALDLADLAKPFLSESILLEIASAGLERSLVTDVEKGVYLNEAGRKTVIRLMEDTLQRYVRPLNESREDTVQYWLSSIPRKLHRALVVGDTPKFPVVGCTLSSHTMQVLKSGITFVPS